MAINFDAQSRIFHLATAHTSYVIGLNEESQALHLYWGAHLSDPDVWAILAPRQMHASFEVESCIKAFEFPATARATTARPPRACSTPTATA